MRESLKNLPFKSRAYDPEWEAKIEEQRRQTAERERKAKVDSILARACIPKKHSEREQLTGNEWGATKARVCGLLGSGTIVGLIGPRGTGKTQIAVEAILDAANKLRPCLYAKAMEMFLTIRKSYQIDNVCEADQIKKFTSPWLLVIDEFGVRGETSWEDRLVTHIIDERYDAGHDTILISNQTAEELTASAGASVVSRMIETGGIIECKWASYRTGKGAR